MNSFPYLQTRLEFNALKDKINSYASSDLGKRLAQDLRPFLDIRTLQEELTRVSECKTLLETDESCPLDGIKDIWNAIHKASIEDNFLTPTELRDVLTTQLAARLISHFFQKRPGRYPSLGELIGGLYVDRVLEYNIDQAIDENANVRDTASKELREIRSLIISKADSLRVRLEAILKEISEQGYAQEEILTTRDGRMVVPVKVEHKHHVPGFIHSSSASGATVFIEPAETLEMNNEIRSLHFSEQREIERILRLLTTQVRAVRSELLANVEILARVDFVFAKAKYSIEVLGAQPRVIEYGPLRLLEARHPILLQRHRREEVIPLNLELGHEFSTLVITGPNAGGKTVALKTVGLLSLMVACGLHISALPDSQIPLFREIFIDIGDEQSIENDLSSFSSHLLNLKGIVDEADDRTLVLIDEIGAGTDPAEGGALAAAILSFLTEKRAYTIATTHQGALKAFAHEAAGFENAAMEFDQQTLRPTYRFKCGIPGSSYALEIAQRMGLPEEVVASARQFLGPRRDKLESLLASLEERSQKLDEEVRKSENLRKHLTESVKEYEEKVSSVEREIKTKRRAALTEAQQIVEKANAVIEASVREIKETQATKETVKDVRTKLAETKREIESELEITETDSDVDRMPRAFQVGDLVHWKHSQEVGRVLSVPEKSKTVLVEFSSVRLQVETRELLPARKSESHPQRTVFVQEAKVIQPEIDLRGMSGEEAIETVDKFLDDAALASLRSVSIIHGKGTGALRKKITEYLKKNPRVHSYRLGEWNEGGAGVTVVELEH